MRGAGETQRRQAARARDHVSDVGVVPVPRRRLHRGRDQGDRVAGPVGLLGRGLDGADHLGDHPGPQTAGPPRVRGAVRTHLRPGRRRGRARPRRWRRWAPRGGRSCAGGGCWASTGSRSTYPTARRTPPSSATPGPGRTARRSPRRGWSRWPSAAPTPSSPPRSTPTPSGRRPWRSGCTPGCAAMSCSPPTGGSTPGTPGTPRRPPARPCSGGPRPNSIFPCSACATTAPT